MTSDPHLWIRLVCTDCRRVIIEAPRGARHVTLPGRCLRCWIDYLDNAPSA